MDAFAQLAGVATYKGINNTLIFLPYNLTTPQDNKQSFPGNQNSKLNFPKTILYKKSLEQHK